MPETSNDKPLINCHTHIFTSNHVPPWLAKTYLFWPAYCILHVGFVVSIIKWWINEPSKLRYTNRFKWLQGIWLKITFFIYRIRPVYLVIGWFLTIQAFFICYRWLFSAAPNSNGAGLVKSTRDWLAAHSLLFAGIHWWLDAAIVLFVFLFFKWGRNLIYFIFKNIWKFLAVLPGKKTGELLQRYLNLARYSFHVSQGTVFGQLRRQYPPGTAFVILPMDMEFMGAGKVSEKYSLQMEALANLKRNNKTIFYPLCFCGPQAHGKRGKKLF